jgi:hypothetical protein
MKALLGATAVDHSPGGSTRSWCAVWSATEVPSAGEAYADGRGASALFAGYLRDLPAGYSGAAAFILDQYLQDQWQWLRTANGIFSFALVDPGRQRCVLGVDRFGMRPLFYSCDQGGAAFASQLSPVAVWGEKRHEMDYEVVQEMAAVGFPLSDRTTMRGILRVPAGSRVECGPRARAVATRYWSVADLPPVRRQSPEEFVDASRERLRPALGRLLERTGGRAMCLLSSGFDSRRLILESHSLGAELKAITATLPAYGRRAGRLTTIEPAITREICRRLGIPHRVVAVPGASRRFPAQEARLVRDILLDFQVFGWDNSWMIPLIGSLEPQRERWNLDGFLGDRFFQHPYIYLPQKVWARSTLDPELLDVMAPEREEWDRWGGTFVSRSLADRLRDAFHALPDGPYRLSWFYILGRARKGIAPQTYGLLDLRVDSYCPFLDNDVAEHTHTADPLMKVNIGAQGLALSRHFPEFADIPSSHTPFPSIPAQYVSALNLEDGWCRDRFGGRDLALLTQIGVRDQRVPLGLKDYAAIGLAALGRDRFARGWRAERLQATVFEARAQNLLIRARPERLQQMRAWAEAQVLRAGRFDVHEDPIALDDGISGVVETVPSSLP